MPFGRSARFVGLLTVLTTAILPATAREQSGEEQRQMSGTGNWEKRLFKPGASPETCAQVWTCVPGGLISMKSGETLKLSSEITTPGSCKAIGADGCRACEAPAPSETCIWEIEQSQAQ